MNSVVPKVCHRYNKKTTPLGTSHPGMNLTVMSCTLPAGKLIPLSRVHSAYGFLSQISQNLKASQ